MCDGIGGFGDNRESREGSVTAPALLDNAIMDFAVRGRTALTSEMRAVPPKKRCQPDLP